MLVKVTRDDNDKCIEQKVLIFDGFRCSFCGHIRAGWQVNRGENWLCHKCANLPSDASSTEYPSTYQRV